MRHTRETLSSGKVAHAVLFDNPVEMLDMVCAAGAQGKFRRYLGPNSYLFNMRDREGHTRDALQWFGRTDLRDWSGVRQAGVEMWKPGADRVKRLLTVLESQPFIPPRDLRRKNVWRGDGEGDFDLDRYCAGRDAWRGPRRREVIGRQFLTFVVDVAANYRTSAEAMYWRAAVAIAAAQTLEEYGYGVEVLAMGNLADVLHPPGRPLGECDAEDDGMGDEFEFFRGNGGRRVRPKITPGIYQDVVAGVWVKRPDDPVDLGMLTAVCSPWFFRLGFFGLFGLIPGTIARFTLGRAVKLEESRTRALMGPDANAAGASDREQVIVQEIWSEDKAIKLLRQTLRRFADPEWLADNPDPEPKRSRE